MDFETMAASITPDIYENMKTAVETGKWPDGRIVTSEQKKTCMQTVLVYEAKNLPEEERVGYIDRGSKDDGEMCDDDSQSNEDPNAEKPLKIIR